MSSAPGVGVASSLADTSGLADASGVADAALAGRTAPAAWRRPMPPAPGPVRFARYAFGPNRLGYCGPDEAGELFAQATRAATGAQLPDKDLGKLRDLATQFEGAFPYLQLIAGSNGRPDPLDDAVVEAYWLGGELVDRVRPRQLGPSLDERFRRRIPADRWRWLAAAAEAGAVPSHAFHVLDVFPKVGLMRSGEIERVIETMDRCRVRWGRVLERDGDALVVRAVPLQLSDGRLGLGAPQVEHIRGWMDGAGFVDDVAPGDVVSIHWDWACERLDPLRLDLLRRATARELAVANLTI